MQDIHWQFEKRRSGNPAHGVANRHLDVLANAIGLVAGVRPLGDRLHHRDVVHLLERTTTEVVERSLASEHQDRGVGPPGVRHPGHAVGDTGACGKDRNADLAGIQPSPGISGVHRRLFMANIDDLDALVNTAIIDAHDVAAGEREDTFNSGGLEGLGCKLSTVRHRTILA